MVDSFSHNLGKPFQDRNMYIYTLRLGFEVVKPLDQQDNQATSICRKKDQQGLKKKSRTKQCFATLNYLLRQQVFLLGALS